MISSLLILGEELPCALSHKSKTPAWGVFESSKGLANLLGVRLLGR